MLLSPCSAGGPAGEAGRPRDGELELGLHRSRGRGQKRAGKGGKGPALCPVLGTQALSQVIPGASHCGDPFLAALHLILTETLSGLYH